MSTKPTQSGAQKKLSGEFTAALNEALGKLPDDSSLKRFFKELAAVEDTKGNDVEAVARTATRFYERRLDSLAHATANMPTNPTHPSADDLTKFLAGFSENERIAMQRVLGIQPTRREMLKFLGASAGTAIGAGLLSDGIKRGWALKRAGKLTLNEHDRTPPSLEELSMQGEIVAGLVGGLLSFPFAATSLIDLLRKNDFRPEEISELATKLVQESDAALKEAIHLEATKASAARPRTAAGR